MNLIPKPQEYKNTTGICDLKKIGKVNICEELSTLRKFTDAFFMAIFSPEGENSLNITLDPSLDKEGYILEITTTNINIKASTHVGGLYALQSLRILSFADCKKHVKEHVECCYIKDKPEFAWRGLMLDESRHFFGYDFVKELIDMLALHKLNTLHWHLTDDQGWRIEIKKYPLLTEIGSKRTQSQIHGWSHPDGDGKPVEGYYTQEQAKEIVAYAKERGIQIIPEIDMPAHFAAAFAAYPHLACRETKTEVPWYFGAAYPKTINYKDWNRSACIGKDTTFEFIHDVIDEICEIFPAPYFHIGGDEAPKDEWKVCPKCQAKMEKEGLKSVEELQGYFTNSIQKYLKSKGKNIIGWNEVLNGGNLDSSVLVQYWEPGLKTNVKKHIDNGGKVVLSKHRFFYFDMSYAQYPLKNTYKFKPYFDGIKPENRENILGVEGTVWTEWMSSKEKLQFQLFPRLEALAEVAWYQGDKDFKEFRERLDNFKPILDAHNINYANDKIANVRCPYHRLVRSQTWYKQDEDVEFKLNK